MRLFIKLKKKAETGLLRLEVYVYTFGYNPD